MTPQPIEEQKPIDLTPQTVAGTTPVAPTPNVAPVVIPQPTIKPTKPEPKEEVGDAQRELLEWARRQVQNYPGVSVNDFTDSWSNGKPLLALVHSLKKSAVDYDSLHSMEPLEVNRAAIEAADSELGIPKIIAA